MCALYICDQHARTRDLVQMPGSISPCRLARLKLIEECKHSYNCIYATLRYQLCRQFVELKTIRTCFTQLNTPASRNYTHLLHAATRTCFTQLHTPASRSYTHLLHAATHTCFTQLHTPASHSYTYLLHAASRMILVVHWISFVQVRQPTAVPVKPALRVRGRLIDDDSPIPLLICHVWTWCGQIYVGLARSVYIHRIFGDSLPKVPCMHRIYLWFWPTLHIWYAYVIHTYVIHIHDMHMWTYACMMTICVDVCNHICDIHTLIHIDHTCINHTHWSHIDHHTHCHHTLYIEYHHMWYCHDILTHWQHMIHDTYVIDTYDMHVNMMCGHMHTWYAMGGHDTVA